MTAKTALASHRAVKISLLERGAPVALVDTLIGMAR